MSSRRLLTVRIEPQFPTDIGTPATADISGDSEKVTNPLSSIRLTLAPNVSPAFEKTGRHVGGAPVAESWVVKLVTT